MKRKSLKTIMGLIFLCCGLATLCLPVLGFFGFFISYPSAPPRSWELFDLNLADRTPSLRSLLSEVSSDRDWSNKSDKERFALLYEIVSKRFVHGAEAHHTLTSNWIMAIAAYFHSNIVIMDSNALLRGGHAALCSQVAQVFSDLAIADHIPCRLIGLNGHVFAEGWYDNDWHIADPDLEVLPEHDGVVWSSVVWSRHPEVVALDFAHLRDPQQIQRMVAVVTARQQRSAMPIGMSYHPNAWIVNRIEAISEVIKWLAPIILALGGIILIYFDRIGQIHHGGSAVIVDDDAPVSHSSPVR